MLELEITWVEHDFGVERFGASEELVEHGHVAAKGADVEPIWIDVFEIVWIEEIKFGAGAAAGENGALAGRGEEDDRVAGMDVFDVANIAAVDAFAIKGGNDSFAGWVVGDAAHENGFVAAAGEGGCGIGGAAAGAEMNTVDVDFSAELDLIEIAAFVCAKIVVVDEIDILKSGADCDDASH